MIRFQCENCAQSLKVPESRAGKSGRCPKCRERVTVPSPDAAEAQAVDPVEAPLRVAPPVPTRNEPPPQEQDPEEVRRADRELLASVGITPLPEYTGERRLPWPIDILLYPMSGSGLAVLAVVGVGTGLLTLLQAILPLPAPLGLVFWLAGMILGLYYAWYLAECTYDSARGGTRAPNLAVPGLSEMWSRVSYLLAVYIVYLLPVLFYRMFFDRFDEVFWALAAWAILFFPIGLLAMIVEDSTSALNPLFLLDSIRRVFVPYLGLLLLTCAVVALAQVLPPIPVQGVQAALLALPVAFASLYASLVYAHILGRFCWRYRERLDWSL